MNYATVHVQGKCSTLTDDLIIIQRITELPHQYENTELNIERFNQFKNAIVFFEIQMNHIEAKFELNPNKTFEDQQTTIFDLQKRNHPLAILMQNILFNREFSQEQKT
jgi:predicted FMN-binding regulatory protein PaiB